MFGTMFQTAELGQKVSKSEFKERELVLRGDLLALQREQPSLEDVFRQLTLTTAEAPVAAAVASDDAAEEGGNG